MYVLTERQMEIFHLIRQGLSNKMIAKAFGISSRTVESHLSAIYEICEVECRYQLFNVPEEMVILSSENKKYLFTDNAKKLEHLHRLGLKKKIIIERMGISKHSYSQLTENIKPEQKPDTTILDGVKVITTMPSTYTVFDPG
jgi:DNA-binding CsgD family transcriptional regulator